jgi:HNH endonuclease
MNCIRCQHKISIIKDDGLCGKCRSRKIYLENVDKYRKTKICICGKKILKTSEFCSSCSQLNYKNHQWKETTTDRNIHYTIEYRLWRKQVFEKYGKKCLLCQGTYRLAAHHILPKREHPELQFDVNNGVPVCHKCHSKMQFKEHEFVPIIMAELKLCELGELCDENTEPSQIILEGVTTRGEINSSKSAGQPLQ